MSLCFPLCQQKWSPSECVSYLAAYQLVTGMLLQTILDLIWSQYGGGGQWTEWYSVRPECLTKLLKQETLRSNPWPSPKFWFDFRRLYNSQVGSTMSGNLESSLSIFDNFLMLSLFAAPRGLWWFITRIVLFVPARSEAQGIFLAEFMTICSDNVSALQSTLQLYSDNKRPEKN